MLSLYASGRSSGVVLEAGAGSISVSVIWEGYLAPPTSLQIGGDDITKYLQKLLIESGYQNTTKEVAEKIKEVFRLFQIYSTNCSRVSDTLQQTLY